MIPQLYRATARYVKTERIGGLADATECTVKANTSGEILLEMSYPIGGVNWDKLAQGNAVVARTNHFGELAGDTVTASPQTFVIVNAERELGNTVRITAEHASYDYTNVQITPFLNGSVARNAAWAWTQAFTNAANLQNSIHLCQVTTTVSGAPHVLKPQSMRSFFYDVLIPTYGGELKFNNLDVYWQDSIGLNRGVKIRYAKNLLELKQEEKTDDYETAIYPYYGEKGDENNPYVELPEKIVEYGVSGMIAKIVPVDLTSRFEQIPTVEQLRSAAAAYADERRRALPPSSLTIKHIAEDKDKPILLGDTVEVFFEQFGLSEGRKVVETKYDVLRDRLIEITVGDPKSTLAATLIAAGKGKSL